MNQSIKLLYSNTVFISVTFNRYLKHLLLTSSSLLRRLRKGSKLLVCKHVKRYCLILMMSYSWHGLPSSTKSSTALREHPNQLHSFAAKLWIYNIDFYNIGIM